MSVLIRLVMLARLFCAVLRWLTWLLRDTSSLLLSSDAQPCAACKDGLSRGKTAWEAARR
jgi:hypothetical protein